MTGSPSPFRQILGPALDRLPAPVQRVHDLAAPLTAAGLADIAVTAGLIPWIICALAGLPRSGRDVPVRVSFSPDGHGAERWVRRFGNRRYASTIRAGRRGDGAMALVERLGPFQLFFELRPDDMALTWRSVGWRCLGVPLPAAAVPRIACRESAHEDRFVFDIEFALPVVGPVIRYRGWLLPDTA